MKLLLLTIVIGKSFFGAISYLPSTCENCVRLISTKNLLDKRDDTLVEPDRQLVIKISQYIFCAIITCLGHKVCK